MRLPDFSDRGFCRVSGDESEFDSGEQATRRHSLSPLGYSKDGEVLPDIIEDASGNGSCTRTKSGALRWNWRPDDYEPDDLKIPQWLQRDEEADAVD